ncbi:MAG: outer membrane beta-barrel protein [Gammaproteobacteria bacterium]|nr:outer membrane beta-barrel protein [Gammaproteobacteria bacterium]
MATTAESYRRPAALLIGMLVCGTQIAFGATPTRNAELTPMIGYRSGGSFEDRDTGDTLDLDEGGNQGLIFNLDHDADTQWEILYSRQDSELQLAQPFQGQPHVDVAIYYLSFGGAYVFHDTAHPGVEPFVAAGIGLTHMSPDGLDAETRPLLSLGAGYKFFLSDNFGVRLEGRAYATALDSNAEIFCGNGACIARVESDGFWQYEVNAGLTLRF